MAMKLTTVIAACSSPTLKKGIGLALLPKDVELDTEVGVDVRGRREIFMVVKPPFVRNGGPAPGVLSPHA